MLFKICNTYIQFCFYCYCSECNHIFFFSVGTAQLGRCKEEALQITEMPHCLGVDVDHRVSGGAVVGGF